jgi:hypothetical protein
MQGNTRIYILKQRGYDVDQLLRTAYVPIRLPDPPKFD